MQRESERGLLGDKMSEPDSKDLLPEWDKSVAWQRLETRLDAPRRKAIPMWFYTSAAAAILLFGFFIFMKGATYDKRITQQQKTPAVEMPVPMAKSVLPPDTFEKDRIADKVATIIRRQHPKAMQPIVPDMDDPINSLNEAPVTVIKAPAAAPAIVPPVKIKRIFSEPVYTLNEIMDNVPEREEKPKTFTGIFHLKIVETRDNEPSRSNSKFYNSRPDQEQFNNDN